MKARINGVELYFDVEGAGLEPDGSTMREKPVCFLLHGGPGMDHTLYKPSFSPLAGVAQLVYLDERGTGRSTRDLPQELCTLEHVAADVDGLREHLGLERIAVLGASAGGMAALEYACAYPDRLSHLILACTSPSSECLADSRASAYERAPADAHADLDALFGGTVESDAELRRIMSTLTALYVSHRPELYAEHGAEVEAALDRISYSVSLLNWGFAGELRSRFDMRDRLKRISAPTLILAGREDWAMQVRNQELMEREIADARLVVYEDCGHLIFWERLDEALAEIGSFLAAGRSASAT